MTLNPSVKQMTHAVGVINVKFFQLPSAKVWVMLLNVDGVTVPNVTSLIFTSVHPHRLARQKMKVLPLLLLPAIALMVVCAKHHKVMLLVNVCALLLLRVKIVDFIEKA